MEAAQVTEGEVYAVELSPVDRLIAEIEAKPEATYPGKVVASMMRLVLSLSGPPVITVHPTTDGRKGRKRTEEQRQRMADGCRLYQSKRRQTSGQTKGGDVADVTTFHDKGHPGAVATGWAQWLETRGSDSPDLSARNRII